MVADFRSIIPQADIYVYDNNSSDETVCPSKGRGSDRTLRQKVRARGLSSKRMFREIYADLYVMVDGDSTYPAGEVRNLDRAGPWNEATIWSSVPG